MNDQLISVVVPVYNTGKYLIKCVNSIINQSHRNLEILIIDDGSDSETYEICDNLALLDGRIKVVHQLNGGLSAARNVGIDLSTGEYITFVDSDDYISSTMYEDLLSISDSNILVTTHSCRVTDDGTIYTKNDPFLNIKEMPTVSFVESILLHQGDISVCTKLFHKDLLGSTRFVTGKTNEDLLFILEILKKVQYIKFTGKVSYYHLQRPGSLSSGYGPAVIDMVENSFIVQNQVTVYWPTLLEQSWRFVFYQHMAFILLVPIDKIKDNLIYSAALSLIRSEILGRAIRNRYLTFKQKVILGGICVFPKFMALIYQNISVR